MKGKTTRLIDRAVQDFFNRGFCYLYKGRNNNLKHHQEVLSRFMNRLRFEHNIKWNKNHYDYNYSKYDGVWCYKITNNNYVPQ